MNPLSVYKITFSGLKEGSHNFNFEVSNQLFLSFQYLEFNNCKISADVNLIKKSNLLEIEIKSKGTINLNCHVSDESFDYFHNEHYKFVVKFGNSFNDEDPEMLVVPFGTYEINISQQLYEMIVLSLPLKVVHPGINDGTLKSKALERLKDFQNRKTNSKNSDPRWDKLKDLK